MRVRLSDGVRVFVDVEGTGLSVAGSAMVERQTLVLLHGGQVDHTWFRPRYSRLAPLAQLLYLDRRGGGRSDLGERSSWTLERWADDVYEVCDALGVERPVVLGSSLGGTVAMAYAIRHPEHPGGLILASTSARHAPPDDSLAVYRRLGGEPAAAAAERFWNVRDAASEAEFIRICAPLHARYEWSPEELARMKYSLEATEHWVQGESKSFNLLPDLYKISCPTLVIAGEDDPMAPPTRAREIADAMSAGVASLELVPNAGHGVDRDDPDRFFGVVEEFFSQLAE